jgi:hypothetical protein
MKLHIGTSKQNVQVNIFDRKRIHLTYTRFDPTVLLRHYATPTEVISTGRRSGYEYEVTITSCSIILNLTPTADVLRFIRLCFDVEVCFA